MCSRSPAGARDLGGLAFCGTSFGGLVVVSGGLAVEGPEVAILRELEI